jgi:hypothetical protein
MLAVFLIWSATAAASPTFGVMNADGGIYWRSAPTWSAAEATPGNGIYPDSIIAPICYEAGAADVPGSGDDMWELATVVGGSGSGTGFVNEHFIDDSQAINTPSPGSPRADPQRRHRHRPLRLPRPRRHRRRAPRRPHPRRSTSPRSQARIPEPGCGSATSR